jgi:heme/copper-type cytochrome/quinol oxidase subunit 4
MDALSIVKTIWPLIVIQLALQIYALVDLFKKKKTKNLSVGAWAVIIIFGEIIGASLYLLLAREEE